MAPVSSPTDQLLMAVGIENTRDAKAETITR